MAGYEGEAVLYGEEDKLRIGDCTLLPKEGDLCLVLKQSGDCFYDYALVRKQKNGMWKKVGKFRAHSFGKRVKMSKRNFHLLLVGDEVSLNVI